MIDIAIIGGGPAGSSAAVYTARADQETIIFDKGDGTTENVDFMENVYGFPEGATGPELVEVGQQQATKFGAEVVKEEVVRVAEEDNGYLIETEADEYTARGIILATGASYESPAIPHVDDYEGKGVSYCVECDAFFYQNSPVAVVGTGNYAAKEALMLLDYTDNVRLLTNGSAFEADSELQARVKTADIPVRTDRLDRLVGEDGLEAIRTKAGERIAVDGLFVALGTAGGTDIAETLGIPVEGGEIETAPDQSTAADRVYAAGDVTGGQQQISTSVGEGARAAINLLEEFRGADYVDYKKIGDATAD